MAKRWSQLAGKPINERNLVQPLGTNFRGSAVVFVLTEHEAWPARANGARRAQSLTPVIHMPMTKNRVAAPRPLSNSPAPSTFSTDMMTSGSSVPSSSVELGDGVVGGTAFGASADMLTLESRRQRRRKRRECSSTLDSFNQCSLL